MIKEYGSFYKAKFDKSPFDMTVAQLSEQTKEKREAKEQHELVNERIRQLIGF